MEVDITRSLFVTNRYPRIQYLVIPKCGCTFVKNLLWRIDHGVFHSNPPRVHDSDELFPRAIDVGFDEASIRENTLSFTVFRNPVDRFFSLYFDKVVGGGFKRFVPLRDILVSNHGLCLDASTALEHQRNCMILLDWIESSLAGDAELPVDPHWTPQGWRMPIIKRFNLKILMLGNLQRDLDLLLKPLIPNAKKLINGIERNNSVKPISREHLLNDDIDARIAEIYHHDKWLTYKAWKYWQTFAPSSSREIPRISDILESG